MKIERIYFKNLSKEIIDESFFDAFILDEDNEFNISKRKGFVVIPGGGYAFISYRESEPVASYLNARGYNAFVLHYSCEKPYPIPHKELALMIDYINKHREDFNLSDDELGFVGFSAGAHLLASFSYLSEEFGDSLKPQKIALAYPVISMNIQTKSFTAKRITNNFDAELVRKLSVEQNITKKFPKTYVFSSKSDKLVPIEHSMVFAKSLKENNVDFKHVVYEKVDHGISIANRSTCLNNENFFEARNWFEEMLDYLS